MNNILYYKNTRKFRKEKLPRIIEKFHLNELPSNGLYKSYTGDTLNMYVDKHHVRVDLFAGKNEADIKRIMSV